MTRLSDTQATLLSAAAARKNRSLLPPPETLNAIGKALECALAALVKRGLATETRARSEAATWRREEDGTRVGLVITDAGLAAIGIEDTETGPERAQAKSEPGETPDNPVSRPSGKRGKILTGVEADGGATIGELAEAAAWQPHTTRAELTRLRQRGFDIRLETVGERKAYRLHAVGRGHVRP